MFTLLTLPFRILSSLLTNPVMLRFVALPVAVVLLLLHFAPPQFWPLFRLYALIEVALALLSTAGR